MAPTSENQDLELEDCGLPEWLKNDLRINEAVKKAVEAAMGVIEEASDGSTAETELLQALVAQQLMNSALMPTISKGQRHIYLID